MERFLKSRYRIGEKIGENPFSVTYKGYLIGTEVPVVIKIYKRSALNSPLINKLRPKVTKIVSLDHPNIARVIDGDYGWQGFYFVREYLEGESMEDFMLGGIPSLNFTLDVIKQVLSALAVAHAEGLLHGAVNSRNIFLLGKKEVKVADFILESAVRTNPSLLAEATSVDPNYMSPEQIKGEQISPASDIYSSGVLLYLLLTGKLPFNGGSAFGTALGHISTEAVPPSHYNGEVPEYLDKIVMKMLEKDPLQRLGDARSVLDSLENQRLVFKLPNSELVNLIYEEDVEPLEYKEEIHANRNKPRPRKKVNKRAILFLFILIAVAGGLWYAFIFSLVNMR